MGIKSLIIPDNCYVAEGDAGSRPPKTRAVSEQTAEDRLAQNATV